MSELTDDKIYCVCVLMVAYVKNNFTSAQFELKESTDVLVRW